MISPPSWGKWWHRGSSLLLACGERHLQHPSPWDLATSPHRTQLRASSCSQELNFATKTASEHSPCPGHPVLAVEERGQSQHWRRASGAVPDRALHTPPLGALLPFFGVSDPFLGAYHTHCLSCVSSVLCHHPGVQPRAGTSGAALWELLCGPEWVLKGCLFVFPSSRALGEMP